MKRFSLATTSVLALAATNVSAWAPASHQRATIPTTRSQTFLHMKSAEDGGVVGSFDPMNFSSTNTETSELFALHPAALVGAVALACPSDAWAASAAPDAVPSALAAYGHYLSLLIITASIMTERVKVKAGMSIEDEKQLGLVDGMTGVAGVGLLVSGYYRTTQYGKGWDFYSHEPIFWLKMTFLGIFGALSLFPTITIIKRTVEIQQTGTIEPMSEKLASRLQSVMNAELSALAFIPLTATLMSRGVGYVNDFPTQFVGPALFGVVTAPAVFKYAKDALTWTEDEKPAVE